MDQQWPWNVLPKVMPVVAGSFALAYDVGHFSSFDINWFSFFSLSEHVQFALRALPIAIGASVIFLIGLNFFEIQSNWKWLASTIAWVESKSTWLKGAWLCFLIVAAIFVLYEYRYFSLSISIVAVILGTLIYHSVSYPHGFARIVYWAVVLIVLSFTVGFATRMLWFLSPPTYYSVIERADGSRLRGHVMHPGEIGVLFYEYDATRSETNGIIFLRWDQIKDVRLCMTDACS
jgi:hypothetical protein